MNTLKKRPNSCLGFIDVLRVPNLEWTIVRSIQSRWVYNNIVMQLIKQQSNIQLIAKFILGSTVLVSSVLLFSIFIGTSRYFGWNSLIFVFPIIVSFYILPILFGISLSYSAFYVWAMRKWPIHTLTAMGIMIIVYFILMNTK